MADSERDGKLTVLLSRDELLLLLNVLEAETMPGIDADPLGEMGTEQRSLANVVALRGLRARGLAQQEANGQIKVQADLLRMTAACVFSSHAMLAFHWPSMADSPERFFGHVRDAVFVGHTHHDDVLHRLTRFASRDQLAEAILDACHLVDAPAAAEAQLLLSTEQLATARQQVQADDIEGAVKGLAANAGDETAAGTLVEALVPAAPVTILQSLRHAGGNTVRKTDLTLLQSPGRLWLATTLDTGDEAGSPLLVKTTSRAELAALLGELL